LFAKRYLYLITYFYFSDDFATIFVQRQPHTVFCFYPPSLKSTKTAGIQGVHQLKLEGAIQLDDGKK